MCLQGGPTRTAPANSDCLSLRETTAALPDTLVGQGPVPRQHRQEVRRMTQTEQERRRRFDDLFRIHSPSIIAYCGWRLGSESDAQDAVAEVFLTAWRRLDEVPEGVAARVWLYATARRVMANQRRSSRRRLALREERPPAGARARAGTARARRPRPGCARGPGPSQAARPGGPAPRRVGGHPPLREIAAVMGCLTVTARGRLHRARLRFRAAFEELLAGEADDDPRRATSPAALGSVRPLT